MVSKLKTLILSMSFMLTVLVPAVAAPALVSADTPTVKGNLCKGANTLQISSDNAGASQCNTDTAGSVNNVNNLIQKIINIFSVVVGIIAVIMIIYAGFRYITSGGASDKVGNAKNTILYALIGLIIVALAQLIVKFVLSNTANLG
jgi:hypothetical protein